MPRMRYRETSSLASPTRETQKGHDGSREEGCSHLTGGPQSLPREGDASAGFEIHAGLDKGHFG